MGQWLLAGLGLLRFGLLGLALLGCVRLGQVHRRTVDKSIRDQPLALLFGILFRGHQLGEVLLAFEFFNVFIVCHDSHS